MTPLIFVIVSRLIAPSDYGVFVMAGFVLSFASVFWNAGLAKTLIRKYEAYRAIGHPEANTKLQLIMLLICLPCYFWAAPHGLQTFLMMRIFSSVLILVAQLYFAYFYLKISPVNLFKALKWIIMATGVVGMGLFIENRIFVFSNSVLELLLTICSGILLYFGGDAAGGRVYQTGVARLYLH